MKELSERAKNFIGMIANKYGEDVVCIETDIDMPREEDTKWYALVYDKKQSKTVVIEMFETIEEVEKALEFTPQEEEERTSAVGDLEHVLKGMGLPMDTFTAQHEHKDENGNEVKTYQRFMTYNGHIITMVQPGFHYCKVYNTFVMIFTEAGVENTLMYSARDLFTASSDGNTIYAKIEPYNED